MSAPGFTPVQLYRSTTAAAVPTAGNLVAGELAINLTDEKLYFENASGVVKVLADSTYVGTVTSVSGTGTVSGLTLTGTVTTSGSLTLGGTLSVVPSDFAPQLAKTFLAAPNGVYGTPTFRTIVASDVPTLNQNTTGTAANVTGIVAVANGGTGVTTSTGTTSVVLSNSPTLVTPTLGAASATSIANGLGAEATPSYTFTGDLNTGMWSPAADTLAFSEGGSEVMRITSNGRLGVGTTVPGGKLHVSNGSSGATAAAGFNQAVFENSGNSGISILSPNTSACSIAFGDQDSASVGSIRYFHNIDAMLINVNAAERMRIDSSGRVGIGTSSPAEKLTVNSASSEFAIQWSGPGNDWVLASTASRAYIRNKTASLETLSILNGGNVGIGTSSPAAKLDVNGTGYFNSSVQFFPQDGFRFTSASAVSAMRFGSATAGESTAEWAYDRVTAATTLSVGNTGSALNERMRIDSSGNVGIGTTVPAAKLAVSTGDNRKQFVVSTTNDPVVQIGLPDWYDVGSLAFINGAGGERMRIDSTGNVGIGTTSPGGKLDVVSSSFNIVSSQSLTSFAAFQRIAPAGQFTYDFYTINGVEAARITVTDANLMAFATGSAATERMRIDGSGNVGIGETAPDYKLDVNGTFGFTPGASVTPVDNGDVVFELTNNTTLTVKAKGSDGVVRSGTIILV